MQEQEFTSPIKEDIENLNKAIDINVTALKGVQYYNKRYYHYRDYSWQKLFQALKDIWKILINTFKGEYYEL